MLGLAKLIPGFSVLSKVPLVHMPLNGADSVDTSQQALAGKTAMTAGQVGRDVATYNVSDMFQVAKRTHMVSHELDHFRKLVERFILGSDVTTFDPVLNTPAIKPFHTKVTVENPQIPLARFTPPNPLRQGLTEDLLRVTGLCTRMCGRRPACSSRLSQIKEFL